MCEVGFGRYFFLWPPRMAGKNQANSASQHKRIFSHACQHVSLLVVVVVGKRPQEKKEFCSISCFPMRQSYGLRGRQPLTVSFWLCISEK